MEEKSFSFQAGQIIMMEGEKPRSQILIIQEGSVRTVSTLDSKPEVTGPGSMVGLVSALVEQPPQETVTAVTNVKGFFVKRPMFKVFFKANPSIVIKIFQTLTQQKERLESILALILLDKADLEHIQAADTAYLYRIGQCYEKADMTSVAYAAYEKYLSYNPSGPNAAEAQKRKDALSIKAKDAPVFSPGQIERQYPAGSVVFLEGEPGDNFYLIRSGMMRIAKTIEDTRIILGVLRPGNVFGETVVASGKSRSCSAIAHEDCTVMSINFKQLEAMATSNAPLAYHLISSLAARVWYSFREMELFNTEKNRDRIIGFLNLQLQVRHVDTNSDNPFRFDFSGAELLNMTGNDNDKGKEILGKALGSHILNEKDGRLEVSRVIDLPKAFTR
jgi:CRP/FNR family transcriptional regulator